MRQQVKINKTVALLMLLANAMLVLANIGRLLRFHNSIAGPSGEMWDTSNHSLPFQSGLLFFQMVVLAGLLWLLINFKEQRWVQSGVIVYFSSFLFIFLMLVISTALKDVLHWEGNALNEAAAFLVTLASAYMVITCFFVKHKAIKVGFIVFAVVRLWSDGLIYGSKYMYEHFSAPWIYNQSANIIAAPYLVTLILFIYIYRLSCKQRNDNEPEPEPVAAFNFNHEL